MTDFQTTSDDSEVVQETSYTRLRFNEYQAPNVYNASQQQDSAMTMNLVYTLSNQNRPICR